MKKILLAVVVAAALAAPAAAMAGPSAAPTVVVRSSSYGSILFDGRGFVLYAFTHDGRNRSNCYGACAKAWPPYYAKGVFSAGAGTKKSLIGSTRRSDGKRQVTYAGRPLYYYVGDNAPAVIRCQNVFEFGGLWLVLGGTGKLVK